MMTCKEFVVMLAAGVLRKMRFAEDEALAAAAQEEETLAKKVRLAEEKADWATAKELKRAEKVQKQVCGAWRVM